MPRPAPAPSPAADPHGDARAAKRRARARSGARDAVADTLRELRERAVLTQEQLGERAGLHRTYVGGYERAERRLTIEAVEQVLAALGVTWAAFGAAMDARLRRPAAAPRRAARPAARRPESRVPRAGADPE